MLKLTPEESDIEIVLAMPRYDETFDASSLAKVINGVNDEDMRVVDELMLAGSYAMTAAFIEADDGPKLAGYVRQLERNFIETTAGKLCLVELGTLWVDPTHRRSKIATTLLRKTTELMTIVNFVPVAICNDVGKVVFESVGYKPVGQITSQGDLRVRAVEMYQESADRFINEQWSEGLKAEVLDGMKALPRFEDMFVYS